MTIKAEITEVQIGVLKIQGLMSEDGDFGVAVPQLVDLDLIPPKRSAKQLEALLGKGFSSPHHPSNMRKHIGKIGRQSLGESRTVKGWMGDGSRWQAIIPHPTGENIHKLEAEITAALGTDDWGLQNNLGLWAVAKKAAKAHTTQAI